MCVQNVGLPVLLLLVVCHQKAKKICENAKGEVDGSTDGVRKPPVSYSSNKQNKNGGGEKRRTT